MTTKKALIVQGGWEGHHPRYGAELFGHLLLEAGYEVTIRDSLNAYLDNTLMANLDLIVNNWTMGQINGEQMKGLSDAISAGTGLGGWHGGLCDAFRENTWYQFMTGGQFVDHPGGIIDYTVKITRPDHPITTDIPDFSVKTEQYYMHVDPGNEVLATTEFSGEHRVETKGVVMPVVWTKRWGQGKVFYCSLGHHPSDFDVPPCREIIRRGLLWATR